MSDISVIYPCYNRLYYTQITLPQVINECRNSKHNIFLYIIDDMSSDGTKEFIESIPINECLNENYQVIRKKVGNSTDQINEVLSISSNVDYIIKVDNDTLIPDGCFDIAIKLIHKYTTYGFLGFGLWPRNHFPFIFDDISLVDSEFIGGIGIFRKSVFDELGPISKRKKYFGFGKYQKKAKEMGWGIAWINGIRIMDLDESAAFSHINHYKEKGFSRNNIGEINSVFNPINKLEEKKEVLNKSDLKSTFKKIFKSNQKKIKLSILILSITSRLQNYLLPLIDKISKQIKDYPVELIVLTDNQQQTIGSKRNQLLENSQGEYICFIDDDDDISDKYIEKILLAIDNKPDCIVFNSWVTLNNDEGKLCKFGIEYENQNLEKEYRRSPNHLMVIKKNLLANIRFKKTNFGEDTDWSNKIKHRLVTQERIDEILYYYKYDKNKSKAK